MPEGRAPEGAAPNAMLEIGDSLREARERRQLSYADVEAATLIPARYVEALEAESFDRLPEGLYRRSFLREYADYLGLDGKAYVAELEERDAPTFGAAPVVPAATVVRRPRQLPSLTNAAFVVGALLLVGIAAWKLASGDGGHARQATRPPATTAPVHHTTTTAPPPATTTTPVAPPKKAAMLVITAARGDCWLSVQIKSSGKTVYAQTLAQGGSVRFGLKQPLLLRFGAPSSVTATIGGRDVTASLASAATSLVATAHGLSAAA